MKASEAVLAQPPAVQNLLIVGYCEYGLRCALERTAVLPVARHGVHQRCHAKGMSVSPCHIGLYPSIQGDGLLSTPNPFHETTLYKFVLKVPTAACDNVLSCNVNPAHVHKPGAPRFPVKCAALRCQQRPEDAPPMFSSRHTVNVSGWLPGRSCAASAISRATSHRRSLSSVLARAAAADRGTA